MKTNKANTGTGYRTNNTHGAGYKPTHSGSSVMYENGSTASSYYMSEETGLQKEARRERMKEREQEAYLEYKAMKQALKDMRCA